MKFLSGAILLLAGASSLTAFLIPESLTSVSRRKFDIEAYLPETLVGAPNPDLVKRKGGGGARGGGSSSSGSSSSGGGARAGSGSSSSIGGGRIAPSYGGGRYYGGGAAIPYRSGGRTPGGLLPIGLFAGAAIFPGLWLASVYAYNFNTPYRFYNASAMQNETKPVTCVCQRYSACGCADNEDQDYIGSLIGNGSYSALDKRLVQVANVNGTERIVINGTLENDTLAAAATENVAGSTSGGASIKQRLLEYSGFWVVGAIVGYAVWFM